MTLQSEKIKIRLLAIYKKILSDLSQNIEACKKKSYKTNRLQVKTINEYLPNPF